MGADQSSPDTERLRQVLGAFYKTVDVMKSARNSDSKNMNVWADDMKAVEDVVLFLENLRDDRPATPAGGEAKERVMGILDPDVLQLPKINLYKDRWDDAAAKADAILAAVQPAQCSAGSEDKEGARLSNWLADYSHDLMEEGDFDQEAAELNRAAQWIADRLNAPAQAPPVTGEQELPAPACHEPHNFGEVDPAVTRDCAGAGSPKAGASGHVSGQSTMVQELQRQVITHERLQARIAQALGRETWRGDLADAVASALARPEPNRQAIAAVVRTLLTDGAVPEYKMDDDRGLEENEYVDFAMQVLSALSSTQLGTASTTAGTKTMGEAALTIAIPSPEGK